MSIGSITETTQYLSFKLGDEIFAIDVAKVREILDVITITKIPQTPSFMQGVINLRGGVVPVMDMRLKFGMPPTERTVNTCIIVMEVIQDGETMVLGSLADSVQEVLDLEPEQIESPPRIGTRLRSSYIKGMGKQNERFIIILDIDRIFSADEPEQITGTLTDDERNVAA